MNKKTLVSISILIMIIASFGCGFYMSKTINSSRNNSEYGALEEIMAYLNLYHYKKPEIDELYNGALNGACESLDDVYTCLIEPSDKDGYTGLRYTKDDDNYYIYDIYDDSPFYNKLYFGDIIYKVNDIEVKNLTTLEFLDLVNLKINDNMKIEVTRNNQQIIIEQKAIKEEIIVKNMINQSTAYIKIKAFEIGSFELFRDALIELEKSTFDKLIIDLRDNPGGSLDELKNIINLFAINKGKAYMSIDNYDGTKEYYNPNYNNVLKSYDIDCLVNENSASAAEAFVSVMSEYLEYDIIGTTTYGKGVYQASIPLERLSGYYLNVTVGKWYTPNDNNINLVGFEPNIKVMDIDLQLNDTFDNSIDSVSTTTKNAQKMSRFLGYTGRIDGYFDQSFQEYLIGNYNSTVLTSSIYYEIFSDYLEDYSLFDPFIQASLNN